MIAGIRAFFRFLRMEKNRAGSVGTFESPRLGRTLPDVLSVAEIDAMTAAIDPSREESLRNRAIIETLYGSGLRVSELVDLRLSRLNLKDGFLIVEGKGASSGSYRCRRWPRN